MLAPVQVVDDIELPDHLQGREVPEFYGKSVRAVDPLAWVPGPA